MSDGASPPDDAGDDRPATDGAGATEENVGDDSLPTEGAESLVAAVPDDWLAVYLKGVFMGAADTVPGVSGGTIALITGIYERLIAAVTALSPAPLRHLPRLHTRRARAALLDDLAAMGVPFLLVLGTGIATAVVTMSGLLEAAIRNYPGPTNAFFFGLIGASAVVLYRHVDLGTVGRGGAAVAGVVVAFLLTDPTTRGALPSTLPVFFVAGTVAVTAMILPGISGSFILYVLGQYEALIGVPHALVGGLATLVTTGRIGPLLGSLTVATVFGVGAVVGLLTVAHAIRWALDHYHEATLAFLVSLMVGSLRLPVTQVGAAVDAWTLPTGATIGGAAVVGTAVVLGLDHFTDDLVY